MNIDRQALSLTSAFEGDVQVKLQCFAPDGTTMKEEEGWYSVAYRQRTPRTAVSFNTPKTSSETLRYVTVIYPYLSPAQAPDITARLTDGEEVIVTIDGKERRIK